MGQFLNELLKIKFDSTIIVQGCLKMEVTHAIMKSYDLVQNFLKSNCLPQNEFSSDYSSTHTQNNGEKSKLSLAKSCTQLNAGVFWHSKSSICLPSYINEETIGGWCTSCLKDALCVALFYPITKLSGQVHTSSSVKTNSTDTEEICMFNCCGPQSDFTGTAASKSIDFPNTSDNSAILLPLDANARSQEDSLGLTHVCGGIICGTHSLECSSGHKSLEIHNEQYSSTLSSSQCSRTMTSGIVNANALMDFSWQQLNTGNWKDVAIHWRYLYTWSCMAQISLLLQCLLRDLHTPGQKLVEVATSVQRVVRLADMGLLMGAPVAGSPLAPCASVLNPLARLSLAADERGLVPEGENMGQCRLVLGVKESNEAPLNDGQDSKVKETNLNVPLAGGSLTEGSEGNHTSQSTQSLQENSSKRWKDDANPVISGDDFPSRQGEKAETQTKLTLNSAKNRAQIFLPSESFQSNSNNDYKVTSYSSKDPPQSMKVASTSPFHELHFEGLLKSKLRALHLSPVTDFYMNNFMKQEPVKLLGLLDSWPAMKKWSPDYLRQLAGARTVPIEVGARYTDSDWSQELITLDRYVTHYMTPHAAGPPGYLAQHQLLDQIPELLDDILVPDYCHLGQSEPRLNAWIGPRGTVSPLHYDPDHNILAQVVGYKYVRLYAAAETPRLYPHDDALLCNTSRVDVEGNTSHFPEFDAALFNDLILAPGDCVYIPPKCWHYVRSLSVSFSVSFWWS